MRRFPTGSPCRTSVPEEVTFRITAADGYFTTTGRFNMLNSDQDSVAAGTWITVADSVTVGPGATVIVPFTTSVPDNAQPGDYAAGIAASIMSVSAGSDGSPNVGVESRVGFRVMTRVTGELAPQVSVEGATSDYRLSWNPFRPGSATLTFDVVDSGNTRLIVDGSVSVAGRTVPLLDADAPAPGTAAG